MYLLYYFDCNTVSDIIADQIPIAYETTTTNFINFFYIPLNSNPTLCMSLLCEVVF